MRETVTRRHPETDTSPMPDYPRPGLLRHLAAMLYDAFLVIPIIMAAVALATLVAVTIAGDTGEDYSATLPPLLVQALAVSCIAVFYGYFWRLRGQTLGMQAWRIRLRSQSGEHINRKQVVLRCLGALFSVALFGLGYLWCLVDRQGHSWHDMLSGTELELLPKKPGRKSAADSQQA